VLNGFVRGVDEDDFMRQLQPLKNIKTTEKIAEGTSIAYKDFAHSQVSDVLTKAVKNSI
jgi:hypothetical protein